MYEFPLIETKEILKEPNKEFLKIISNYTKKTSLNVNPFISKTYTHKLTHQTLKIQFWENLAKLLQPEATVIFNAGIGEHHQLEIEKLQQATKQMISFQKTTHVKGTNTLLLGKKIE